jgi:hypothetical protein
LSGFYRSGSPHVKRDEEALESAGAKQDDDEELASAPEDPGLSGS